MQFQEMGALSPFFCAYRLTLYVDPTSTPKRAEITLNVRFMGCNIVYGRIAYNLRQKNPAKQENKAG